MITFATGKDRNKIESCGQLSVFFARAPLHIYIYNPCGCLMSVTLSINLTEFAIKKREFGFESHWPGRCVRILSGNLLWIVSPAVKRKCNGMTPTKRPWCVFLTFFGFSMTTCYDFDFVERIEWGAKPPVLIEKMPNPVPIVIIHHSYKPPACNTTDQCIEAMHWMQNLHMITNGWNDIGYNFAVGGDAKAYVGRGWSRIGAHAKGYNNKSIGICIIGDWRFELPPEEQLATVHKLIELGVELGKIAPDYVLYGHRQVRDTECPGDRLFKEINTWQHFSPTVDNRTDNLVHS